jgi:hypothetical protein
MSLHLIDERSVPEQSVRVARAAVPKRSVPRHRRDALRPISAYAACADLFPQHVQLAESPARLALVSIMPFAAGLSDRPAAEGVRRRSDGTQAVGLPPLTVPGCAAAWGRSVRATRRSSCPSAAPTKGRGISRVGHSSTARRYDR